MIMDTFDGSDRWDEPLYSDRLGGVVWYIVELLGNDILGQGQSVRFRVTQLTIKFHQAAEPVLRRTASVLQSTPL